MPKTERIDKLCSFQQHKKGLTCRNGTAVLHSTPPRTVQSFMVNVGSVSTSGRGRLRSTVDHESMEWNCKIS